MSAWNDSPPPSWYEPPDPIETDELEDVTHEDLVIGASVVWWSRLPDANDL